MPQTEEWLSFYRAYVGPISLVRDEDGEVTMRLKGSAVTLEKKQALQVVRAIAGAFPEMDWGV